VRQQADGIDTHGERRQAEPEPRASFPPPLAGEGRVGARAASSCRGEDPTPALPEDGEGEPARASFPPRRGVLPRRNGPERSAGVQPARPQPGRRHRSPAVNAGKIPEGHCGSSRRSLGGTNPGPGPAQAAGGHARAPATPAERDEKLKIPC
jgi:hypothetical protein